ncbi:hypothetical protein [Levilactobacillus enshiensis]|uniref:hypothetical protein n=1 Tax=Levilactobacillus enshiensis TaxID=2590213 RepID=UPI001179C11E|nr:hypothetical protein [Levilactobacillus enshiensis]
MKLHDLREKLRQQNQHRLQKKAAYQQNLDRESRLKTGHDAIVAQIAELFATPDILHALRVTEEEWTFVQYIFQNPHFMEANSLAELDLSVATQQFLQLKLDPDNERQRIWKVLNSWNNYLQNESNSQGESEYEGPMKEFFAAECMRMRRYLLHDTSNSRVALAPYTDQFVTMNGHVESSELSERGTEVRVLLTDVLVRGADKTVFYNHLNVYAPIALAGKIVQQIDSQTVFNGIVAQYHRSLDATEKGSQAFAYGVEKISFGEL